MSDTLDSQWPRPREDTALQRLIDKHKPTPKRKAAKPDGGIVPGLIRTAGLFGTTLYRNNVGTLQDRHGHYVTYGLCLGSSDCIGYTPVVVTQEMVGTTLAVFTAVEAKKEGRDTTDKDRKRRQGAFLDAVRSAGGIGAIVRSEAELIALLK